MVLLSRILDLSVLAILGLIALGVVLVVVGLALWVAGTISRGGLISAVNDIELETPTNFFICLPGWMEKGLEVAGD